ncbi:hypothetical protein TsocGM_24860 [Tautonia sociabilis]|uniref:Pentapeptide repeat-containing protein n=1 Tax=Tautonia sociabilis TaxID=2080755 RepID=A0A432MC64_9BACT|nr:hypothetical protein TsocGM_24860 [Tautonia sociabilis]
MAGAVDLAGGIGRSGLGAGVLLGRVDLAVAALIVLVAGAQQAAAAALLLQHPLVLVALGGALDLRQADLRHADLGHVQLRQADLRQLEAAVLRGAGLGVLDVALGSGHHALGAGGQALRGRQGTAVAAGEGDAARHGEGERQGDAHRQALRHGRSYSSVLRSDREPARSVGRPVPSRFE